MKPSELSNLLSKTIQARLPVLITGAPGVGKSDVVAQAASEAKSRLIISHPVVSDPTDFKGLPFPCKDQETAKFLPFGDLALLVTAKEPTVFFLDDLGQAPPSVQAACMQLLLARRVNGHRVSEKVCFLAATNRRADKAGVQGLLEPVKSRFATIVNLEADLQDWCTWAVKNQLPTELIGFLRFRPHALHDFKPTADLTNGPCPRTWHNVARLLQAGVDSYEAISGAVGEGYGAEFLGFLKIYRTLPDPKKILEDPANSDVPQDGKILFALCSALAYIVTIERMPAFVTYINRLPAEFSVMAMRDATDRHPKTKNTSAFVQWVQKHADVMM